jgi:glycosyltransferase involved in cell wall biosynthesis
MAAGRPVLAICPDSCEMARMIREQEIGFVIANGDVPGGRQVLLEARANPARLERMGANAARYLRENFTLAQAARAYFDTISGAAARAGCSAATRPGRRANFETQAGKVPPGFGPP